MGEKIGYGVTVNGRMIHHVEKGNINICLMMKCCTVEEEEVVECELNFIS